MNPKRPSHQLMQRVKRNDWVNRFPEEDFAFNGLTFQEISHNLKWFYKALRAQKGI